MIGRNRFLHGWFPYLFVLLGAASVFFADRVTSASEKPIVGALAGLFLFPTAIMLVNYLNSRHKAKLRRLRPSNAPYVVRIAAATIADDLVPIMTPHVGKGVVISILGFDSHYTCSKNGPKFLAGLEAWLQQGASLRYLLLSGSISDSVRRSLEHLVARYPGAFSAHLVGESADAPRILELIERYRTFHPTLLEGADKKAMWVETFHDAQSVYAYGVKFVSPEAMGGAEAASFNEYRSDFDLMVAAARPLGAPVADPQPLAA